MWSSFLEYGYWKLARAESDRPQPLREERERESQNVPEHDVGCFKKNVWELYGVLDSHLLETTLMESYPAFVLQPCQHRNIHSL